MPQIDMHIHAWHTMQKLARHCRSIPTLSVKNRNRDKNKEHKHTNIHMKCLRGSLPWHLHLVRNNISSRCSSLPQGKGLEHLVKTLARQVSYQVKLSRKRTFHRFILQEQLRNLYTNSPILRVTVRTCMETSVIVVVVMVVVDALCGKWARTINNHYGYMYTAVNRRQIDLIWAHWPLSKERKCLSTYSRHLWLSVFCQYFPSLSRKRS